jgi:hypothetical protein
MKARIKVGGYWFVSLDGAWTPNGEQATVFTSVTGLCEVVSFLAHRMNVESEGLRQSIEIVF